MYYIMIRGILLIASLPVLSGAVHVSVRCFGYVRKVSRSKIINPSTFFVARIFETRNAIYNNFARNIVMVDEKRVC